MKKLLITIAVLSVGLFSHVFAVSYSVGINLDARVGGYIVGGGTTFNQFSETLVTNADGTTDFSNTSSVGQSIGTAANEIDDSEITFTASVDNVSASITFERAADDNAILQFDSAHLQVSDLFGMVTLRFFDWDYSAGSSGNEGNYILSDLGFQGFYIKVKPIDLISVGLGFGLNSDSIRGLRLDATIGGPVPTSIYVGLVINSIDNQDDEGDGIVEEGTIERFQLGFESKLYGNYANLGFGILPLGSTLKYYTTRAVIEEEIVYSVDVQRDADGNAIPGAPRTATNTNTNRSHARTSADPTVDSITYAISLSGGVSLLDGLLGLDYAIQYIPDTITKVFAAGRGSVSGDVYPDNHSYQALQADADDLWENIAVRVNPYITIGQIKLEMPIKFQYYGTTYSDYQLRDKPLIQIGLDPSLIWTPAAGFFVQGTIGFDFISQTTATVIEELGDYSVLGTAVAPGSMGENLPLPLEDISAELRIGVKFGVSSE